MKEFKKFNRGHIGELFISNEGYELKIIDGGIKPGYCTVLVDNNYESEFKYDSVKKGMLKNVYHKSIHNIGYFGFGKHRNRVDGKTEKKYTVWLNMLARSYNPEYHKTRPTYENTKVCQDWHNFQVFSDWFENHYIENYHLDKDLLQTDLKNKVYSPSTCVFIPRNLNAFLSNNYRNNTSGYIGVSWNQKIKKWRSGICINGKTKHLGSFNTKEEAAKAYKIEREVQAEFWCEKMRGMLSHKAIKNIK